MTGTRTATPLGDAPVATEVITREEIESSGALDVASLLEEHPGIDLYRSYLGAAVRMQGFAPDQMLILIDGQRVLGAKDGVIDLERFTVDHIERIEIVKGPSSALYGSDAMGGVINLITRGASAPFEATAGYRMGGRGNQAANLGVGFDREKLNSQFTGGYRGSEGYDLNPEDIQTTGSAYQNFDVSNRSRIDFSPDVWMMSNLSYLRRDLQGIDASASGSVFDRRNRIEDFRAYLSPKWILDERSMLSVVAGHSIYRDQYFSDQRRSDRLDSYTETLENLTQASAQYDRLLGERHFVTVGIDGLAQSMESDRLEDGEGYRSRLAFFAQDNWQVADDKVRLDLLPGMRLDLDSWFGTNATPKIAARLDPSERVVLRGSLGLGYRAPDFKELLLRFENIAVGYVVEGNPDLKPETSRSAQLGIEVQPAEVFWLSANGFYNEIDDLILIGTLDNGGVPGPTRFGYINVAEALTRGVETGLRLDVADPVAIRLGYTYTDARDRETDLQLQGRATHRGNARVSMHHEPWNIRGMMRSSIVGARVFYIDEDFDGQSEEVPSDPYVTLDARLAKGLGPHLEVYAGADNLLDEGDATFLTMPPRLFYIGVNGRFQSPKKTVDPANPS